MSGSRVGLYVLVFALLITVIYFCLFCGLIWVAFVVS